MAIKDHLTDFDPLHNHVRAVPGMAFYSGTGPAGKTCGQCAYWTPDEGFFATGAIKPRRCAKFSVLAGQAGPRVAYRQSACKYFVENPNPPPAGKHMRHDP